MTTTTRVFPVIADPGHSWAKVPMTFLARLLGAGWRSRFTSFSYEKGGFVYLEEDEDVARLIHACRATGIEPIFKLKSSCNTRYSRVRTYQPLRNY